MRFVQLDEKNEERMNAIRKFTLMDDTFMTQVFSGDKESTQELLRIILKRKELTVARSATQLTIGNLFGRSVRLDIYATDDAGKQYDIEVQQEDKGAAPERARLNSAMFDSRLTTSGEKYSDLPETYIIFITANDVLGDGLPVYNIERTIQETGKLFHDRAHIVYVNGAYRSYAEHGSVIASRTCSNESSVVWAILSRSCSPFFQRLSAMRFPFATSASSRSRSTITCIVLHIAATPSVSSLKYFTLALILGFRISR